MTSTDDDRRGSETQLRDEGFWARRRYVRRVDNPAPSFFPWGFIGCLGLALIALYALFPFAFGRVQSATRVAAESALTEIDADWARVRASGQRVILEGTAPSANAANEAVRAVRRAKSRTLFGQATAPTRVFDRMTVLVDPDDGASDEEDVAYFNWRFSIEEDAVRLSGDVPSASARQTIVDAARNRLSADGVTRVIDELIATTGEDRPEFTDVAIRGVETIMTCEEGTVSFVSEELTVNCEVPQAQVAEVRRISAVPLAYGKFGDIDVIATEEKLACNENMARLLTTTKIEFASSSSTIRTRSDRILNDLADAARVCPGRLRIEGHTDDTGSDALNARLSRDRAVAVRRALVARGLPEDLFTVQGYGSSVPLASNRTPEGRARNRRIEIRVIGAGEQ